MNGSTKPTPRERQVLELISHGHTYRQIAVMLGASEHTINNHVSEMLERLGFYTRSHAVAEAIRNGWIN